MIEKKKISHKKSLKDIASCAPSRSWNNFHPILTSKFSQKQNFVEILMKKVEAVTHQVGVATNL